MILNTKIYTLTETVVLIAGANVAETFNLFSQGKIFYIKSVYFDMRIQETALNTMLNLNLDTTQNIWLRLGTFGGRPLCNMFSDIATPLNVTYSGDAVIISKLGQYFFGNLKISETLPLRLNITNGDAIKSFTYEWTVTIEIIEET